MALTSVNARPAAVSTKRDNHRRSGELPECPIQSAKCLSGMAW
jgi:hypothetical protein